MKVVVNEKSIKRNARIGQYTSLASLLILGGGMYLTFTMPEQVAYSFGALLLGFVLSQVGIYFGNRWGRRPRMDEQIAASLKGLTRDYALYHYETPVSHLLVGPAGIWILEPYYQRGTIVYEKGKWKQKGGGLLLSYLKIFAQEGLGRPDLEIQADMDNLATALKKELGDNIPEIHTALIFTDDRVELEPGESPYPMLRLKEMKEFFRRTAKASPMPAPSLQQVMAVLPQGIDEE